MKWRHNKNDFQDHEFHQMHRCTTCHCTIVWCETCPLRNITDTIEQCIAVAMSSQMWDWCDINGAKTMQQPQRNNSDTTVAGGVGVPAVPSGVNFATAAHHEERWRYAQYSSTQRTSIKFAAGNAKQIKYAAETCQLIDGTLYNKEKVHSSVIAWLQVSEICFSFRDKTDNAMANTSSSLSVNDRRQHQIVVSFASERSNMYSYFVAMNFTWWRPKQALFSVPTQATLETIQGQRTLLGAVPQPQFHPLHPSYRLRIAKMLQHGVCSHSYNVATEKITQNIICNCHHQNVLWPQSLGEVTKYRQWVLWKLRHQDIYASLCRTCDHVNAASCLIAALHG